MGSAAQDKVWPFLATKDPQSQGWTPKNPLRAECQRQTQTLLPHTNRLALFSFFRRRSLMLTRRRYWLSLIMSRTLL